jgi:HSP20 family molecular chaperone IbpA
MAMANSEKKEVANPQPETEIKYHIRPTRFINYDCAKHDWKIEFQLPGVKKENIDLKFLPNAYHLKAKRGQALYHASEYLPFKINSDTIEADYDNGMLSIKGKIKDPLENAVDIKLE